MLKISDTTTAYIAGLIDGEGYIGIKRTNSYACQGRKTPGYHARIQIRMVHEAAIQFLSESLGGWYYKEKAHLAKGRPLFWYQASDLSAEEVIQTVLPYLRVKNDVAKTVLELRALQLTGRDHRTKITGYRNFPNARGTPRRVASKSFSDEFVAKCDALYMRCKTLNRVGI